MTSPRIDTLRKQMGEATYEQLKAIAHEALDNWESTQEAAREFYAENKWWVEPDHRATRALQVELGIAHNDTA